MGFIRVLLQLLYCFLFRRASLLGPHLLKLMIAELLKLLEHGQLKTDGKLCTTFAELKAFVNSMQKNGLKTTDVQTLSSYMLNRN
jgi:hypothetical protein